MAKITVNVERYKGEYELDKDIPLNSLEWRWIKQISGYLPLTIETGFDGDDPDLYLALAVVAMQRAGKIRPNEVLLVSKVLELEPGYDTAIVIDFSDGTPEEEMADVGES